jgi:trigger factor
VGRFCLEYEVAVNNELEKEIEISVPSSELDVLIDQEADKLRKKVEIKGFRKGRVPKPILKSKYHDAIKAQAIDTLVSSSYIKVLEEKKWRLASQIKLLNFEEGDTITFRLRFEVIPHFEVDNYRNVEVLRNEPVPDDVLLEQGLQELRERHAAIKEVSRPAVVDDIITMDLEIREKSTVKDKGADVKMRIGDRNLPDEINRALVGVQKSEHKEVKIGNTLYKICIKKVEEKEIPQIDDAFAKSLSYENTEQLKKKLTEDVKKFEEKRIEEEVKESLSKIILERIRFNVPRSLIQHEYERILQRSQLPDSDANKERFWHIAEKRVRFNLILEKIAEKENISVNDNEIQNAIASLGITLHNENRDDVTTYFRNILYREKTIDFIYKNAHISEKSRIISPKEAINDTSSIRH